MLFLIVLDYARMNHPFAPKNIDLRGHIGNVFATDRQKLGGRGGISQATIEEEKNESNDEDLNESDQEDYE